MCGEDKIGLEDSTHFLDTKGRCGHRNRDGKPQPHRVCGFCVRRLVAEGCRVFNVGQDIARWILSLGSTAATPTCPVCYIPEPTLEERRPFKMSELCDIMNGHPFCPCPTCVHARLGEDARKRVSAQWDSTEEAMDETRRPKTAVEYAMVATGRGNQHQSATFQGHTALGMERMLELVRHQAMLQSMLHVPYGTVQRCPVAGCDSAEYTIFRHTSQSRVFHACGHEVCVMCNKEIERKRVRGADGRSRSPTTKEALVAHTCGCLMTLGAHQVHAKQDWSGWRETAHGVLFATSMRARVEAIATEITMLKCPHCGITVAKSGACNHVTCSCGEHLCQSCHRRVAHNMPHDLVAKANELSGAPYASYAAVDEVAVVPNHYAAHGWSHRVPRQRLCPRSFAELGTMFPIALSGIRSQRQQRRAVGATSDTGSDDMVELTRQEQALRLRVLARLLDPAVVTPQALKCTVEVDTERCGSRLFGVGAATGSVAATGGLWPTYPYLTCHEAMFVLWTWGFVDPCDHNGGVTRPRRRGVGIWTCLTPGTGSTADPTPLGRPFVYHAARPDVDSRLGTTAVAPRVLQEFNRAMGRHGHDDPLGAGYGRVHVWDVAGDGSGIALFSPEGCLALRAQISDVHKNELRRVLDVPQAQSLEHLGPGVMGKTIVVTTRRVESAMVAAIEATPSTSSSIIA